MTYSFPPDVDALVREQMLACGYENVDQVLRDALAVFRDVRARQEQLRAEIQVGIDEANQGLAQPLDLDALIQRCTQKLSEEGITD